MIARTIDFLPLINRGGVIGYIILFLSIVAIAMFIERLIVFNKARIDMESFLNDLRDVILEDRIKEAITLCSRSRSSVARVIGAGLRRYDRTREEVKDTMQSIAKVELSRLEKTLGGLATIASIAPLLGFLGTVTGMIKAFRVIEMLGGTVNAMVLAGGIWEALITTVMGLVVAIPVVCAYNYLVGQVESFARDMERSAVEVMDMLMIRRKKIEPRA